MLFPTADRIDTGVGIGGVAPGGAPFLRLLTFTLAHKGRLLAAAVLGALLTGLVLCFVPPTYEAEAVVIIDSRRNKLADAESALSSIVVDQYQSALKSELSLIESPDLARNVIASLGLLRTADYESALSHVPTAERFAAMREYLVNALGLRWLFASDAAPPVPAAVAAKLPAADPVMDSAVKIFTNSFWAINEPKSLTIRFGYRSSSPQLAAAVTNAALQRYLAADEEVKAAAINRSEEWLRGRIAELRTSADAADQAVEAFRASHDLATIRDRSPLEQQLLQLQTMRVDVQTNRGAARAKASQDLLDLRLASVNAEIQAIQDKINTANADDIKLRTLEQQAAAKRTVLTTFTQRYDQDSGSSALTPPDSRVVSWATVPVDAKSPRYGLTLAAGTIAFTAIAFLVLMGLERLRPGFGGIRELEDELGLVVAGITPGLPRARRRKLSSKGSRDAPPFRELALTVRALAHAPTTDRATKVVLVTSAVAGEGKSTMALSLARSAASGGQRCLLIEADIRNPTLHASLGIPGTPGLVELTLDHARLAAVIRNIPDEQFDFLSAGRRTPDALTPFAVDAFRDALDQLKRVYDVIVIDSAPVLLASEVLVLSGCAELTLFVVKWRTTPREIARKASAMLTRSSAGPCVAVLSQVNVRRLSRDERRMEQRYRRDYQFS